jgi:serine/threonine protein phosphatase PrpC
MLQTDSFSKSGRKGSNQDCIFACVSGLFSLLAIADGMGGKEAGMDASKIAIDIIKKEFSNNPNLDLPKVFRLIKEALCDFSIKNNIKQMGTTLTVCLMNDTKALVAHVGDTRLYQLRHNGIVAITKDQTEVQKLIDDGVLTKKRAVRYHRKNVLLSALTNYSDYSLFQTEFYIGSSDRLLLLSDGVYNIVSKKEIRDLSIKNPEVSSFVGDILSLIESREIKDDYSVVVGQVK